MNRLRSKRASRIARSRLRELLIEKHRGLVYANGFEFEVVSGQSFVVEVEVRLVVHQAQVDRSLVVRIGVVRVPRRVGRAGHGERFRSDAVGKINVLAVAQLVQRVTVNAFDVAIDERSDRTVAFLRHVVEALGRFERHRSVDDLSLRGCL